MDSVGSRRFPFRILLALVSTLLLAAGPASAVAEEGGSYTLQCFCLLEWGETWDGQGVFNEDDSLDTVALTNDGAVLILHEIPLADGTIAGMVEDRTATLEDAVDDYDETPVDAGQEDWVLVGRSWTNAEGDAMLSAQHVQVWETNFLLSIEFVAPEADFVDAWETLDEVLLVGAPILEEFDGTELLDEIA